MEIIKLSSLSEQQTKAIRKLEKDIFALEQLENEVYLSNEINFDTQLPCFYMGYEKGALIAFLTTFMPTSTEAEVLAFTHPSYRKQGCFKALLNEATSVLQEAGISKLLWVVEPKSESGKATLKTFGGSAWERSEYRMVHTGEGNKSTQNTLKFVKVDASNRKLFATLTQEAFPDVEEDSPFIEAIVASKERIGYLAFDEDKPVGIFNLNAEEEATFLYGIGVATGERGKGYGKAIVAFALEEGLKVSSKVILDVDSENPVAFNLYKKCGFQVDFQVDYYSYPF